MVNASWLSAKRGSVLLLTLWFLVILSLLALEYSVTSRMDATIVLENEGAWQRYFHALEALEVAERLAVDSQNKEKEEGEKEIWIYPDGRLKELKFPWGKAWVALEDEEGKVNLNRASWDEIHGLLIQLGLDEMDVETIADSILDWRDEDDLYRVNGAEDEYYQSLSRPYHAANGPFKTLTELILVKGVTYSMFWEKPGLWRYFTIYSSGRYNPQLSPMHLEEADEASPPPLKEDHVYRFCVYVEGANGKPRRALIWWGRHSGGDWEEVDKLVW